MLSKKRRRWVRTERLDSLRDRSKKRRRLESSNKVLEEFSLSNHLLWSGQVYHHQWSCFCSSRERKIEREAAVIFFFLDLRLRECSEYVGIGGASGGGVVVERWWMQWWRWRWRWWRVRMGKGESMMMMFDVLRENERRKFQGFCNKYSLQTPLSLSLCIIYINDVSFAISTLAGP